VHPVFIFGLVRMTPCMGKVGPPGAVCVGVLNVGGLRRPVCSLFITFLMKYAETECPVILIVDCNKSHVTAVLPVLLRKWHCGESSYPIHHTDCNICMSHSVDHQNLHFRGNALCEEQQCNYTFSDLTSPVRKIPKQKEFLGFRLLELAH
jgi:hypothetical protein